MSRRKRRHQTRTGGRATVGLLVSFAVVALGAGACRSGDPAPGAAAVPTTADTVTGPSVAAGVATAADTASAAPASTATASAADTATAAAGAAPSSESSASPEPAAASVADGAAPQVGGPVLAGALDVRFSVDGPVVEQLAPAGVGLGPDGVADRGEFGEVIAFDETALLACAHNEYAVVLLQQGEGAAAAQELARAAARARVSASTVMAAQHDALLAAAGGDAGLEPAGVSSVVAALCRTNGFRA